MALNRNSLNVSGKKLLLPRIVPIEINWFVPLSIFMEELEDG
jgi:hypothetical protein